jgi:hypothetical protein
VYGSRCTNGFLDPAVEKLVVRSRALVHSWGAALWAGTHSKMASHDELSRQSVQASNRCSSDLLMRFALLGILLRVTMPNISGPTEPLFSGAKKCPACLSPEAADPYGS